MGISMETVKELREKTNAGMMDCKKALESSGGDIEGAVEYLRKKGLATAAKKASRIAAEGLIASAASRDGKVHALVEVNCETDFVVKTDDFQKYAASVAALTLEKQPKDVEALGKLPFEGRTVSDYQTGLVAKIGENIRARRLEIVRTGGNQKIAKYVHPGSRIVALVVFEDPASKLTDEAGREIAMHTAAMNPSYVSKEEIPQAVLEKEKAIFKEQMANEKKPPEILEKIIQGKLAKQLAEVCLEDQIFVKDPDGKMSVKNVLKKIDPGIKIRSFIRLQVGEGIEKKG